MDAKIQLQSNQVSRHDRFVRRSAEDVCVLGIFQGKESQIQYNDPA